MTGTWGYPRSAWEALSYLGKVEGLSLWTRLTLLPYRLAAVLGYRLGVQRTPPDKPAAGAATRLHSSGGELSPPWHLPLLSVPARNCVTRTQAQ